MKLPLDKDDASRYDEEEEYFLSSEEQEAFKKAHRKSVKLLHANQSESSELPGNIPSQ